MRYGEGPYGEARMAVCNDHALEALQSMDGALVEIRRVYNDVHYACFCAKPATFFLLQLVES